MRRVPGKKEKDEKAVMTDMTAAKDVEKGVAGLNGMIMMIQHDNLGFDQS